MLGPYLVSMPPFLFLHTEHQFFLFLLYLFIISTVRHGCQMNMAGYNSLHVWVSLHNYALTSLMQDCDEV